MTLDELTPLLAQYRAALDAEIALLQQLQALAARELTGVHRPATEIADLVDERERVMSSLVAIEAEIVPVRRALTAEKEQLSHLPDFQQLVTLHRQAAALVQDVILADNQSREALHDAELARRVAVESMERSESTLAAYRRVVLPSVAAPALVNRKG